LRYPITSNVWLSTLRSIAKAEPIVDLKDVETLSYALSDRWPSRRPDALLAIANLTAKQRNTWSTCRCSQPRIPIRVSAP